MRENKTFDCSVTVIIPTYNERNGIETLIESCLTSLKGHDAEIIVVDDNSPDRTAEFVNEVFAGNDRVRVIRRTGDRGRAKAILKGMEEANGDLFAVMDADHQHPPEKLPDLFSALSGQNVNLVIGSRYVEGGFDERSLSRRVISKLAILFVKSVFPDVRHVADPISGFFTVEKGFVQDICLTDTGSKVLIKILIQTDRDSVVEIPYSFAQRRYGESKFGVRSVVHFLSNSLELLYCYKA